MKHTKLFAILAFVFLSSSYSFAEDYRNVPLNSTINTVEPFKGIVLWNTHDKITTYKNSIALEFSYCLYSDVVNETQGVYNWTKFETLLNDIASRGHQAVVRFRYEYPGPDGAIGGVSGACAVPAYIKALPGYNQTYSSNPGGDGPTYYCDWSNAELQRFTKEFYTKFAERYDSDPRVAFVQTGFGHWSEYHIYGTTLSLGHNFPSHAYQKEFLQHMSTTFVHTPWSISIDAADDEYTPIVNDPTLLALQFGVFDDSFMHSKHDISQGDGYNEECWNALNRSRWQFAPGGGEFSYYTSNDQKNALNPAGMYGGTWEQRAAQYHMTYIIGNDVTTGSYGTVDRVKEASMNSGYRFKITSFQVSNTEAKVKVKNTGIAPIYHNAYVTVNGVRSSVSLKGLLPNATMEYTVSGLTIGSSDTPTLTITSDKLLTGATIPYQATLDATGSEAPICSISASKAQISLGQSTTLTAVASSENSSISQVVIKEGNNVLATLTAEPYTYTFTPATTGSYTIVAIATDNFGISTTAESITVTCADNVVEDFENLYNNYVGTDGTKLNTGNFRTMDISLNDNVWSLYLARLETSISKSGSNSLRLQAVSGVGGHMISPLLKETQTVTFYVRMYKNTKTGSLAVYKSTDNYAAAIKTVAIPTGLGDSFMEVTVSLNESAPVKLKIVNTTNGTSTDESILIDDFTYMLASQTPTLIHEKSAETTNFIKQRKNQLEFEGTNFVVNIYNMQGVKLVTTKSSVLGISNLPSGVYFVNYRAENGQLETKKIIKL